MIAISNPPLPFGGFLISVIMGVLVNNSITKANKHFGQYRDNEAELTHGLYEIFCLELPPKYAGKVFRFHCRTFCM
jgi:hypothetical protein